MFPMSESSTEKISASSINICCILYFGVKPDKSVSSNTFIWYSLMSSSGCTCWCCLFVVDLMCSLICVSTVETVGFLCFT